MECDLGWVRVRFGYPVLSMNQEWEGSGVCREGNDICNVLVRRFRQSFNKNQTLDEKFKTISYMSRLNLSLIVPVGSTTSKFASRVRERERCRGRLEKGVGMYRLITD